MTLTIFSAILRANLTQFNLNLEVACINLKVRADKSIRTKEDIQIPTSCLITLIKCKPDQSGWFTLVGSFALSFWINIKFEILPERDMSDPHLNGLASSPPSRITLKKRSYCHCYSRWWLFWWLRVRRDFLGHARIDPCLPSNFDIEPE